MKQGNNNAPEKQHKKIIQPEKDESWAERMSSSLPPYVDPFDQFSMMIASFLFILMKFDPIFTWSIAFVLISLALNSKTGYGVSKLVMGVSCIFTAGLQYFQYHRGALPPPKPWKLF